MNNPSKPDENKDAEQTGSEAPKSDESVEADTNDPGSQDTASDETVTGETSDGSLEGSSAGDKPGEAEPTREDEAASDSSNTTSQDQDHSADHHDHDEHHGGSSFAATALKLLLLVLFIFGLSLWLVPMAAPHLPESIAKRVMPGQAVLDERMAALEASAAEAKTAAEGAQSAAQGIAGLQQEIAALKARLEAAEAATQAAQDEAAAAQEAAEASATATAAATEAGKVASSAMRDTASLARQMTSFEARLANLRTEIQAIGDNLATAATQEGGASSGEITAAFAALKARVDALADREPDLSAYIRRDESDAFVTHDDLRSARTALTSDLTTALAALPDGGVLATTSDVAELRGSVEGQVSALGEQIASIGEKADAATATATQAEAAAADAIGTVAGAIQGASLKSAVAAMESRMANGAPFAASLNEIVTLTGQAAPEALAMASTNGVQTTAALLRRFKPLAPLAIAEDLKAQSGDDPLGQASARLQSVFGGRPKNEAAGDDAGAILSRVEARLTDGDVNAALAEAEALSDAAKAGLGGWLDDLRFRVDADAAAAAFLSEIGASQG